MMDSWAKSSSSDLKTEYLAMTARFSCALSFGSSIWGSLSSVQESIGTSTCSALMPRRNDWLRNPTDCVPADLHLVRTSASSPSRMDPALKPLPYRPMSVSSLWLCPKPSILASPSRLSPFPLSMKVKHRFPLTSLSSIWSCVAATSWSTALSISSAMAPNAHLWVVELVCRNLG